MTDHYDVLIRRTSDGLDRLYRSHWGWFKNGPDGDHYWWTDGNMGCSCARARAFAEVAGEPNPKIACGVYGAYVAVKAILSDGREVEIDGWDLAERPQPYIVGEAITD